VLRRKNRKKLELEDLNKRRTVYDSKLEKILELIHTRPRPKGPERRKGEER
jgi:hypothetical protein